MERDTPITVRVTVLVNGEWLERNYFFREMPDKELCGDLFQDMIESALKYKEEKNPL